MSESHRGGASGLRALAIGAGLAISLVMVWRSQASGDQLYLLARGWALVDEGWLVPFGSPMSGGGCEPGSLTSLLVGLPLLVARDYRAAGVLVLVSHVLAYVILDRSTKDALGSRGRLLLAVAYWLNPWRLYFSAHLWNVNWLFLLGVVHLATTLAQRHRPSFWASVIHVLALGAAFQLHASVVILVLASLLLWWRRMVRPSLAGIAFGSVLVMASLIPWLIELARHPQLAPVQDGFLGRGLLLVYPVIRGLAYWLRYSSLLVGRQVTRLDFSPSLGEEADAVLAPLVTAAALAAGVISLVPSALSQVWLWKRRRELRFGPVPASEPAREWLLAYARLCAVATAIAVALSPTTTMMWQGFIALHAAVIALPLWCEEGLDGGARRANWMRRGAIAWASAAIVLGLAFAVASPMYRRGGRKAVDIAVQQPHEMYFALRVDELSTLRIDPERGAKCRLLDGHAAWEDPRRWPAPPGEKW